MRICTNPLYWQILQHYSNWNQPHLDIYYNSNKVNDKHIPPIFAYLLFQFYESQSESNASYYIKCRAWTSHQQLIISFVFLQIAAELLAQNFTSSGSNSLLAKMHIVYGVDYAEK